MRLALAAAALAVTVAGASAHAAAKPSRILFVGDSLSAGWYASTADKAFPALVAAKAGATAATIAKAGVRISYYDRRSFPAADDVVVELATNDYGKSTPAQAGREYGRLLAHVRVSSPRAKLVCVSAWDQPAAGLVHLDAAVRQACSAAGGTYVDISSLFGTAANRGPSGRQTFLGAGDDFHPNDRGHALIAQRVERALGL